MIESAVEFEVSGFPDGVLEEGDLVLQKREEVTGADGVLGAAFMSGGARVGSAVDAVKLGEVVTMAKLFMGASMASAGEVDEIHFGDEGAGVSGAFPLAEIAV